MKPQVLQALLQASKFADLPWKKYCIQSMEEEGLETLEISSMASFVLRKSFVLRADGKWNESSTLLRECMQTLTPLDPRLNAIRGLLIYSLASNLWEREDFIEAEKQLRIWKPMKFMDPSLYETRSFVRILMGSALVSLHQGHFTEAKDLLQRTREQYDPESRALLDVTASLADVFCELGKPSEALKLLEPIIDLGACLSNRYKRNCYVSYAEASICLHNHKLAESVLVALKQHYETTPNLDRHDRRRHTRILVLLAQNLHRQASSIQEWQETSRRWEDVVNCMRDFDESSNWDFGMVCFSIHHTLIARGDDSEWFEQGAAEFKKRGHFWMRGMTTYWKDFLRVRLPTIIDALA
jgi:tetratricopeptide (TPR) repeat protein